MTVFDLIVLAGIAISALLGYQRGAVRELVGLFAFGVSATAALMLLPITSKFTAEFFQHQHLLSVVVAVVVGFAIVYIAIKLVGHWVAGQVQQQSFLGGADRMLGVAIGGGRALILLGLFALVFDRATPEALKPDWITTAFTYPLASASGRVLGALAPAGLRILGHPTSLLNGVKHPDREDTNETDSAAPEQPAPPPTTPRAPPHKGKGYDRRSREQLNRLLERTR